MGSERSTFTVNIQCADCGQKGVMVWEEDDGQTAGPKGKRTLVEVANGFYAEEGRTRSGDVIIVCGRCKTVQED